MNSNKDIPESEIADTFDRLSGTEIGNMIDLGTDLVAAYNNPLFAAYMLAKMSYTTAQMLDEDIRAGRLNLAEVRDRATRGDGNIFSGETEELWGNTDPEQVGGVSGTPLIKSYGGKGFGGLVSMMSNGGMDGEGIFDENIDKALMGFSHQSQINNVAKFSKSFNIGALVNAIRSIDITSEAKQMLIYLKAIAENSNKTSSTEIIYPNGGSGGSMIPSNSSAGMSSMGSRSGGAKASSPQQIAAMQRKTNPGGTTSLSSMHSKAIELAKGAGFKNS